MSRPKLKMLPEPIYLNQREAAAYLRVKETTLKEAHEKGLINRFKRGTKDFVYKISELLQLAEAIDNEVITIN